MGVALAVMASGSAWAELQRWTDDDGVIYYREFIQVDATASDSKSRPAPVQPAANTATRTGERKRPLRSESQKAAARAHTQQEKHCSRLQARLHKVEQKLDDGYREPQGNQLRRQRRELQSELFRDCR